MTEAAEESQTCTHRDDFYQDGLLLLVSAGGVFVFSALVLLALSLYLFFQKPAPVRFLTGEGFRVVAGAPLKDSWLSSAELVQWVSDALPAMFTLDFVNYTGQVSLASQYFTPEGYKKYLQVLQVFAGEKMVGEGRIFVTAHAAGAPIVLNQGLLQGDYGWWMQMPLNLSYSSVEKGADVPLVVQVLVIRVSTLDDLKGIRIENIVVRKGGGDQVVTNG